MKTTLLSALILATMALSVTSEVRAESPRIYSQDGKYLGNLNTNQYDPNSVANPYGKYGNPYSPDSINNQYGKYGSPYSPYSANNPYATQAPRVVAPY